MFKKGTTLLRKRVKNPKTGKHKQVILPLHIDLISAKFWEDHSEILAIKSAGDYEFEADVVMPELVKKQLHIQEMEAHETNEFKEKVQN